MLQGCHYRHVVGFKHIEPRREDIRQLALMYKNCSLTFAHRQLGAVFDLMGLAFKPPDHGVAAVIGPVNDIDEFAFEKVKYSHVSGPFLLSSKSES